MSESMRWARRIEEGIFASQNRNEKIEIKIGKDF
jgi:hypothetical protein